MPTHFLPGLELSGRLYRDAVRPLLSRHRPGLVHSAALIGVGSEVLGFDTTRSTDHDWGPRLQLFLSPDDLAAHGETISELLTDRLPATVAGFPITFDGRTSHSVVIAELGDWLGGHLGFDPLTGITTFDWLATSTQGLAEVTAGEVFHDGLGTLQAVRRALSWYPDDLWRYVLACQWHRIGQEEAFVGRCSEVGDEVGSAVVAARIVRDLMRLCLLMDRVYPPYSKWLGSAFSRLACGPRLTPVLTAVLAATGPREREDHLVTVYETVAALYNERELTEPVDPRVRRFYDRPFRVLDADRIATALSRHIRDAEVRGLPLTGAVDQILDSTDVLSHVTRSRRLAAGLYLPGR